MRLVFIHCRIEELLAEDEGVEMPTLILYQSANVHNIAVCVTDGRFSLSPIGNSVERQKMCKIDVTVTLWE